MTSEIVELPHPSVRELNAEIKALMGRHDVTQMRMAEVLGITQPHVSARLKGRTTWKIDELFKLAAAFGIHPAVLLGGTPPPAGPGGGGAVGEEGLEPPTFRV